MKADVIYNSSCENMSQVDNDSVGLVVTSPPYFNLREYAVWDSYQDHMDFIRLVLSECYRVLKPGGWLCWNIQECIPIKKYKKSEERKGCYPLLSHTISLMEQAGFLYEKDIIWFKGKGSATQKLFGSYPFPNMILLSGLTEHIITVRKGGKKPRVDSVIKEKSRLTKEEWGQWGTDHWDIPAVKKSQTGHPAAFPIDIPYRLIRMYSFVDDIVLDPFMGSGTTAAAAKRCGRKFLGYELHQEYIDLAISRVRHDIDIFA